MWTAFVNIFLNILLFIYKLVGNFGVAIILFTIVIKLLIHPLMKSQIKSSAAMMDIQKDPELLEIQERYKDNKERLNEEQMKYYQRKGVNPTASCLPLVVQMPVIFALYQAVIAAIVTTPLGMLDLTKRVNTSIIELSDVFPINPKFLWMNLGQPERLNIAGIPFGIPVLAVLVVLTTLLQTKLTQPTANEGSGGGSDTAAAMGKSMNIYMPLLMGFMAYTLASGLALYFLISNIFTIGQYAALGKLNLEALPFVKKKASPVITSKTSKYRGQPKTEVQPKNEVIDITAKDVADAAPAAKPAIEKKSTYEDNDDYIDFNKVDYKQFKNKKKPKKNKGA